MKFFDETRLARARLTNNQHQLPVALPCPPPAPEHRHFFLTADEWREMALSSAAPSAAHPHQPEQCNRLRHTFEFMAAALLGDEQTGDLALHSRRDHDRARLGQRLRPRRDVGNVAARLCTGGR